MTKMSCICILHFYAAGGCVRSTFWNALAAMPASSLFAQVALSNCRDAVVHNVHNWAFSFMRGWRALGTNSH